MVPIVCASLFFNPINELSLVQEELSQYIHSSTWSCQEIGTGNINFIYLADNGSQKVIVKRDLNFARINPEKFPLPIDRLLYEYRAYSSYERIVPEYIPRIYFFDFDHAMLAMEYLSPHILLRRGLIEGKKYPLLAEHVGTFLARSLYLNSCYHLQREEWEQNKGLFAGNTAMRQIILDLNYHDPFYGSPLNNWTSPELDEVVADIQGSVAIKTVVDQLKEKFLNFPESLSHGDLHTGSILVTPTDTRIIDTEFASYAPMSFDIGMLLGNLCMATFAADAYGSDPEWLAETTCNVWDVFEREFRTLWANPHVDLDGKLYEIWIDTLHLMGVEMIRRTIGVAHTADFTGIVDRNKKVAIERKALYFAKELLLSPHQSFPDSRALKYQLTRDYQ